MKKGFMFVSLIGLLVMPGCGDKVSDPEALYQKYLKDDTARRAKVGECKLLSVDEQLKSQICTIAFKADGDRQMKKRGFADLEPVDLRSQAGKKRKD